MNIKNIQTELFKNKTINHIIHFNSISSTNDYAKGNYKKLKHGTVILADEQTKGRGRFDNKWFSPRGKGLYFSVLLKKYARNPELLNLIPAYAVLKTLHELFNTVVTGRDRTLQLKYPNDILINGKKVGGVLVETKFSGKKLIYAVIGIGLNVSGTQKDLPEDIKKTAGFISQFVKNVVTRHALSLRIIQNLDAMLL